MAGKSANPKKHVAKAIILAMLISTVVWSRGGWASPIGTGDYGRSYTLAIQSGVAWLAVILIIDAVISPGGTGLIHVGTTARISYALGLPNALTRVSRRGAPVWSVIVATLFGMIFLAPAPSWQQLVSLITGATAVRYAFASVALGALMKNDLDRDHPYRVPFPKVLLPLEFAFAT